jgi:molecular chaperone DnaK
VCTKLIDRNTTIPVTKKQTFSTAENNQTTVTIHVLQGEREFSADNRTLGRFNLDGIPSAPRGLPQIEVSFDIDANGIVNVTAKDLGSGKEQRITIESSSGLNEADIDRMVKDAEAHASEDNERKRGVEIRNDADALLYTTERSLGEYAEALSSDDKAAIDSAMDGLREALKGEEIAAIEAASKTLSDAANTLSEAMYAKAAQQEAATPTGESGGGESVAPDSGPTVDADFTVVDEEEKKSAGSAA